MTSAGLVQQLVPKPFAHNGTITEIVVGSSTTTPSFDDGFPAAFSSPRSGGGEYILRGMMNAVGNLASANEYFRQAGGLYQFNPEWARLNGGYARGAVLDYLDGNKLYKVISMVDNNKVDYTKSVLTSEQISAGIITGGIDGINWMYCNVDQEVKYNEICDLPNFSWPEFQMTGEVWASDVFQIGSFIAPRAGTFGFSGTYEFTASHISDSGSMTSAMGGFFIAICTERDTDNRIIGPAADGSAAKYIYSRGDPIYSSRGTTGWITTKDVATYNAVENTEYAIYVVNVGGNVSNSNFKVVLI